MAKIRLGRRKSFRKRNLFFFAIVIFLVMSIQTFWYIEKRIEPVLINYANVKVIEIANQAINDAINKKIVEGKDFGHLFTATTDHTGKITSISLDVRAANRIQAQAEDKVRETLEELKEQKIEIPLGVALGSNILASFGPNIPITMVPIGSTEVDMEPVLTESGINNVTIAIYLKIKATVQVVIPFSSEQAKIEQNTLIAQQTVLGEIPNYYWNGTQYVPFQTGSIMQNNQGEGK